VKNLKTHHQVGAASLVTTAVLWLLVRFIPAFHNGVPAADAVWITSAITAVVAYVVAFIGGQTQPPASA
jgi:hypothetical protein